MEAGKGLERKQAAILAPMLTQTATAAKKVVDKKVGVMVRSLESHSSTWLFSQSGFANPNTLTPQEKERERR